MEPRSYAPPAHLDAVFMALADPTRRAIVARLATGEATVGELGEPFDMSQPAVSKHLKVLERAGLVTRRRDAQRRPARLETDRLREANAWLDDVQRVWEANFRRLDALLDEMQRTTSHPATSERATSEGEAS
jgi:DNA-binding transcriptional ArsR family regulator